MRKLRLNIWMLLLAVPLMAGCDGLLDLDINENPNTATEVEPDLLMPTVLANMASVRAIEISPSSEIFSQIWASNGSTGVFNDPERYVLSTFMTGNTWVNAYNNSLKNLLLMRESALDSEPARTNVAAQAEILSSYVYWMLTSLWGPIPFTEALNQEEFPQPAFDDQETVLRGLLTKLDEAIALIDAADTEANPPIESGDLVYGGDMEMWERFANSLKLRILMMIRNQDPSVDAQIATLLNQPLIRENGQEAAIPFFTTTDNENNLWRLNNMFGGFTGAGTGNWFIFAGEALVETMKERDDPRLNTYFSCAVDEDGNPIAPGGSADAFASDCDTEDFYGQAPGVFQYGDETAAVSQNIIREDWPSRIITASEVWLYEAEFLADNGDAGAGAALEEGVERALDYFDDKPGEISDAEKQAYLASLPDNPTVEDVWAQQYIEVYDRSPENWTQVRRTHFPSLEVPNEARLGDIIRRWPYPPDERSANPNVPAPIGETTPMWFEPAGGF